MEVQQQIPAEAIKLYDLYIHGEIPRREFMDRLNKFTVAGLALPALVEALMPNYAAGQQVAPTDFAHQDQLRDRAVAERQRVDQGAAGAAGQRVGHHQAAGDPRHPREPRAQPAHRGRGAPLRGGQLHGVRARRPDLGRRLPRRRRKGGAMFGKVDRTKMGEDLYAAAVWLKNRPDSTGKLGVTGFCFGGGISNALAVRMGADLAAAVPYYGGAPAAADVPKIKAAVLVHHGSEDTRLVMAWPEYEAALKANKVTYEGHIWPDSVHGFNNDATPARYNKDSADKAWAMTVAWFNKYVRG